MNSGFIERLLFSAFNTDDGETTSNSGDLEMPTTADENVRIPWIMEALKPIECRGIKCFFLSCPSAIFKMCWYIPKETHWTTEQTKAMGADVPCYTECIGNCILGIILIPLTPLLLLLFDIFFHLWVVPPCIFVLFFLVFSDTI